MRIARWLIAVGIVVAGCGGTAGSSTTEPLLAIATTPSEAPAATTNTQAPTADVLSTAQRNGVNLVVDAFAAADAATIIAAWEITSDRRVLFEQELEFDIAIGGRWTDVECGLSLSGEARCEMVYTNDLLEALDVPPQDGVFRIGVRDDGSITSWFYEVGNAATIQALAQPFRDWVEENHPDRFRSMFTGNGFARVTAESRALWVELVAEFVAAGGGG